MAGQRRGATGSWRGSVDEGYALTAAGLMVQKATIADTDVLAPVAPAQFC